MRMPVSIWVLPGYTAPITAGGMGAGAPPADRRNSVANRFAGPMARPTRPPGCDCAQEREGTIVASLFIGHGAIISCRLATRLAAIIAAGALAAVTLPVGVLAGPPSSAGAVELSAAVRHDVSPPLRNLRPSA